VRIVRCVYWWEAAASTNANTHQQLARTLESARPFELPELLFDFVPRGLAIILRQA
jgi:hypothetical protein